MKVNKLIVSSALGAVVLLQAWILSKVNSLDVAVGRLDTKITMHLEAAHGPPMQTAQKQIDTRQKF